MAGSSTTIEARIISGAANTFSVLIDHAYAPSADEECFRFALHYYARVLFELARLGSLHGLPEWMSLIAQTAIDRESNFFAIAEVDGALLADLSLPVAELDMVMRVSGIRDREVAGDVTPFDASTLARSVLAVCQRVLPYLSDASLRAFPAALANMNASYELAHRYADPESQRQVPSVAYRAASFV
jgi:hypothetical protein